MTDQTARKVAEQLVDSDEIQLLEELALRDQAIKVDPANANRANLVVDREDPSMNLKESLQVLGRRVLARWNREAYTLVCGSDSAEVKSREELRKAFGLGDAAAAAALTPLVMAIPGMPLALAPVLAALMIKRLAAPALDEFCGTGASSSSRRRGPGRRWRR